MRLRMDISKKTLWGLKLLPKNVHHLSLRDSFSSKPTLDNLALSSSHISSLQSLCIDGYARGAQRLPIEMPQEDFEEKIGELRQLFLSSAGPNALFLRGMCALQSLRLNQCDSPGEFLFIIQEMPQLCLMQLAEISFSTEPRWESAFPVHLPELQAFYLFHDQASMFVKLISLFDAPRLRIINVNVLRSRRENRLPLAIGKYFDGLSKAGYSIQTLCILPKAIRGGSISEPS
jgi:hypothetical protein